MTLVETIASILLDVKITLHGQPKPRSWYVSPTNIIPQQQRSKRTYFQDIRRDTPEDNPIYDYISVWTSSVQGLGRGGEEGQGECWCVCCCECFHVLRVFPKERCGWLLFAVFLSLFCWVFFGSLCGYHWRCFSVCCGQVSCTSGRGVFCGVCWDVWWCLECSFCLCWCLLGVVVWAFGCGGRGRGGRQEKGWERRSGGGSMCWDEVPFFFFFAGRSMWVLVGGGGERGEMGVWGREWKGKGKGKDVRCEWVRVRLGGWRGTFVVLIWRRRGRGEGRTGGEREGGYVCVCVQVELERRKGEKEGSVKDKCWNTLVARVHGNTCRTQRSCWKTILWILTMEMTFLLDTEYVGLCDLFVIQTLPSLSNNSQSWSHGIYLCRHWFFCSLSSVDTPMFFNNSKQASMQQPSIQYQFETLVH